MEPSKLLYFFPDSVIPESLTFRLEKYQKRENTPGVDNKRGLLITPFNDTLPNFTPEDQKWQVMNGINIGVAKSAKPEDFLNEYNVGGYPVILGDGNEWLIPVALLGARNFSLPKFETMDEDGNWIWKVQEKYEFICHIAEKLFEAIDDEGNFQLDENKLRSACCAAIGVNYNLTDMECAALGLLTQDAYFGILNAIIDKPGLAEMLQSMAEGKKKL